jgi:hypothetical protein
MVPLSDRFHEYHLHVLVFLQRADAMLARFDNDGQVSALFYAALELRYGIEARLNEYIDAERRQLKQADDEKRPYISQHLIKYLASLNPDSHRSAQLAFTPEQKEDGPGFQLQYRPMTPELARAHGKLGGFLHYEVFRQNPLFFAKFDVPDGNGLTISHVRQYLGAVASDLRYVAQGTMLTHTSFTRLVKSSEDKAASQADEGS